MMIRLLNRVFKKSIPRQAALNWPIRFSYQKRCFDFQIEKTHKVLDIGSGSEPFPLATHLCDLFEEPTQHRYTHVSKDERPFVVADIQSLPYESKEFDFVYCCHVLEHVDDPIKACREIQRVGKRGFIECPTAAKDTMMSWAKGMHRWQVVAHEKCLVFFEYSERQLDGIKSSYLADLVHSPDYNAFQQVFFENQDVLNTMLYWTESFRVEVFRRGVTEPEVLRIGPGSNNEQPAPS